MIVRTYLKLFLIVTILVLIFGGIQNHVSAQANNPPSVPVNFVIYTSYPNALPPGGWLKDNIILFTAYSTDPDGDNCQLGIEVQPASSPFTNNPNSWVSFGNPVGTCASSGGAIGMYIGNSGVYKMQIKACDYKGLCSGWRAYSGNIGIDLLPPSGGAISYPNGGVVLGSSVTVNLNQGTDAHSGMNSSLAKVQRSTRSLVNGVCTGSDNFIDQGTGLISSFTVNPLLNTCYKYKYIVYDNVGWSTTYTSSNEFFAYQPASSSSSSSSTSSQQSTSSSASPTSTSSASSSMSSSLSSSSDSSSTNSASTSSTSTAETSSESAESSNSTESVDEVVPDDSQEETKKKTFVLYESSSQIEELLENVSISNNNDINEVAKNIFRIGWPTIKISIFPLLFALLLLLNNLYLLQPGLLLGSILSIFMKRKIEQIGLVYDENNLKPIPFVIVRIFDRHKRTMITQKVSDLRGRYSFLIPPGDYILSAEHSDFNYFETFMEIKAIDYSVNYDIGLVRKDFHNFSVKKVVFVIKRFVKQYFTYLINLLFVIGIIVAGLSIYLNPTLLNYLNLSIYVIMLFIIGVFYFKSPQNWGYVYDSFTAKKLSQAFVRLFNYKDKKLIDTQITDNFGRYGFIVDPGEYLILINRKGYSFPSNIIPQEHIEKTFYGSLIKLKVNRSKISNFAIPVDKVEGENTDSFTNMKFASPF